jgi:hypothetical protein
MVLQPMGLLGVKPSTETKGKLMAGFEELGARYVVQAGL